MKKVLEQAPLVHALIHLRFTDVPSLISLQPDLVNKLHLRMIDEGFNEKIPSRAEIIEMQFDAATQQARQKKLQKKDCSSVRQGKKRSLKYQSHLSYSNPLPIALSKNFMTNFTEFCSGAKRSLMVLIKLF